MSLNLKSTNKCYIAIHEILGFTCTVLNIERIGKQSFISYHML